MKWSVRILVLAVLMVALSACVWNLDESPNFGSLTVSFERGDGLGALDLSQDFQSITLVVVEASHFIRGGRTIQLGNAGFETAGPASSQIEEREPLLADSPYADEFQIMAVDGGLQEAIGGGFAFTYTANEGIPQTITIPDLIVGREYVVWMDAVLMDTGGPEGPVRLGFSVSRIRSGAPTTVSINLTEDRFPQLVQTLYDRYVAPFLPPPPDFDLGQFTGFLYAGTGSVDIAIDGGQPQTFSLNRGWVIRFEDEWFEGESLNVFLVGFYLDDGSQGEIVELVLSIREDVGLLEPSRTSYNLDIAEDSFFLPSIGSIFEVDLYIVDEIESDFFLLPTPPPTLLSNSGFVGGSPSQGGTFTFGVSGTFGDFDAGTVPIDISNLSFAYGELLETFDDWFEWFEPQAFEIGDIGPAGGYIFYIDEEGEFDWTYLEVAPAGWSGDLEDPEIAWLSGATIEVGEDARGMAIGTGASNTEAIISALGVGEPWAAHAAGELTLNGFSDWFLPSVDELNLMFQNLRNLDVPLGGLNRLAYWTSTEHSDSIANIQFFQEIPDSIELGEQGLGSKPSQYAVRPIRAFGDGFVFIPPEGFQ